MCLLSFIKSRFAEKRTEYSLMDTFGSQSVRLKIVQPFWNEMFIRNFKMQLGVTISLSYMVNPVKERPGQLNAIAPRNYVLDATHQ